MLQGHLLNNRRRESTHKCSPLLSFGERSLGCPLWAYQEAPSAVSPLAHSSNCDNAPIYWLFFFPSLILFSTHSFSLPSTTNNCLKALRPGVARHTPELPGGHCGWRAGTDGRVEVSCGGRQGLGQGRLLCEAQGSGLCPEGRDEPWNFQP